MLDFDIDTSYIFVGIDWFAVTVCAGKVFLGRAILLVGADEPELAVTGLFVLRTGTSVYDILLLYCIYHNWHDDTAVGSISDGMRPRSWMVTAGET